MNSKESKKTGRKRTKRKVKHDNSKSLIKQDDNNSKLMQENDDSSIRENLIVPDMIKIPEQYGMDSTYDHEVVQKIVCDVATSKKPVQQIIKQYNIDYQTMFMWIALNSRLYDVWYSALRSRTNVLGSTMEDEIAELEAACINKEGDPRWANVMSSIFERKWKYRIWFMSRINRKVYGDKQELDIDLNINAAEVRAEAWRHHRSNSIDVAEFEEID